LQGPDELTGAGPGRDHAKLYRAAAGDQPGRWPLLILIWGWAAWWLCARDQQAWGVFMIVWAIFVNMVDNFIKPWLIDFGIAMPMSLTILGVFGGLLRSVYRAGP
jgi:hypothetical protein